MKFYEQNIDLYIVPSLFVKNTLVAAGMNAAKIEVLPHFISNTAQAPGLSNVRERLKLPPRYALYGGSISKEKNVPMLLELWNNMPIPLLLAGDKEPGFNVGGNANIHLVGQLNREDFQAVLTGAECVVSPSRLPETFGLLALEAIAEGKPFFGFRVGALGEIIKQNINGCLATNNEEFSEYLADYFHGKIRFDQARILQTARQQYGEGQYLKTLEALFQKMSATKVSSRRLAT